MSRSTLLCYLLSAMNSFKAIALEASPRRSEIPALEGKRNEARYSSAPSHLTRGESALGWIVEELHKAD